MARVFGPTRGAGVRLEEKSGDKPIEPGALGLVGYAGLLEKGPTNTLIGPITNTGTFAKKCGGIIADSTLPDACLSYIKNAAGSGGLLLVRVTDGNERAAGPYFHADNTTRAVNLFCRRGDLLTPFGRVLAKNGGRWGGRALYYTDVLADASDVGATTLDTGLTKFEVDEWVGGYIEFSAVPNKRYPIISNDAAGIITVESDQTMATDFAASSDLRYYLVLDPDPDKLVEVEIRDGEERPDSEFGIYVYVNNALVYEKPDLSIDPTNKRYWVDIINKDGANDEIFVEDLFTGARTADVRPANYYGKISTVTATELTAVIHDFTISSPGGGNPTLSLAATTDTFKRQKITITMTNATTGTAVSDRFGALGTVTLGSAFTPTTASNGALKNKWVPTFTVTAGSTALSASDTLVINYRPFVPDELIGGYVYPDKVNAKRTRYRIVANDHKKITAADGSTMTSVGQANDYFLIEAPMPLVAGRNGNAVDDEHYIQQAWDPDTSPFNRAFGQNFGLLKLATPSYTASQVQKAGVAYAAAKNHQYRYEIPDDKVTESDADAYVNDTLGRSDYAVVSFPSFVDVADPLGSNEGRLKRVSATGMIHGREARIASDYGGYHKAGAGVDATLPEILALPTGEALLNEELLNPRGINVIKKSKGNFILWGDRTLWLDASWKFKHQREQMSYYENVLRESFDYIIFGINNDSGRASVKTSMLTFFLPEHTKGALDQDFPFDEACSIKIDKENNTPLVKAQGDMIVEIMLRLVDTVERLRIIIGKTGVFESVV